VLVTRVEPEYPEGPRRARMEGAVILEAVITASGEVDQLRVVKSAGPLLDRPALDAVRRWRYKPATLNGRAVSVYLTVTVTFGLRS
jgi:protein TonB